MAYKTSIVLGLASGVALCMGAWRGGAAEAAAATSGSSGTTGGRVWSLAECLNEAMANNRHRPVSRFAVAIAEAQHRQALSAYWPHVNLKAAYQRMDQAPNFIFPGTPMYIPSQSVTVPGGAMSVTIPAGVLGPAPIQLPVNFPDQKFDTPAAVFPVPDQDIKLMDETSFLGSINATWLLYDGGMRKGLREQARGGIDAARQEVRRTDLELIDSVKRFYYGSVLARKLRQVGNDTLARMEATLNLTETIYKEGSGKVKKTDYLDNKVMVESLRSMVALLEKNEAMAQAALANTMGLTWKDTVVPAEQDLPFHPYADNLENLVGTAYQFSPDWARLEAAIRASEGAVRTAKSEHFPKVAFTGSLHRWWNDYGAGMATDRNKEGWTVGVGMEIPLVDGFLARNRVREARARSDRFKEQQFLLKEGIGLQVKDIFLGLTAVQKSYQATLDAMKSAEENRDLNTRAYQNELVETDKVIRAQLVEALMTAQHYKTCYDHVALQSQLHLVVGTEIGKQLEGK